MRLTSKRNGKNVIPLLMAVCGINLPHWRIDRADDLHSYLSGDAADKLAAYEDAEELGLLVRLPCNVGDKVYLLWPCGKHGKSVSEMVVTHIDIDLMPDIEFACHKEKGTGSYWFFKPKDINKTVFLSRAEAEAALKGEREDV